MFKNILLLSLLTCLVCASSFGQTDREVINFTGNIVSDKGYAIDNAGIQIFYKNRRIYQDNSINNNAFNFTISRSQLPNAKKIKVIITQSDHVTYRRTIKVPYRTNYVDIDVNLRKELIPELKWLGYVPYVGHFTRSRQNQIAGWLFILAGVGGAGMGIYGNYESNDFAELSRRTTNPNAKQVYSDQAKEYRKLSDVGWGTLGVSAGLSILTNILQKERGKRRYTLHFDSDAVNLANIGVHINLN